MTSEITDITETAGRAWASPGHDKAGNMTMMPQPKSMTGTYTAVYGAWNRLVKLKDAVTTSHRTNMTARIDALSRRSIPIDDGTLDETRHVYYSSQWQQLEVRVGGTDSGDRRKHYMWGARYIDALIQRKRDTGADGSFDETHYALQDANFRVTAITDGSGSVVERYRYTSYGNRTVLNADWSTDSDSDSDVNMRSGQQGLYHDAVTGLIYNRNRMLHASLRRFMQRDPLGYVDGPNLYQYEGSNPVNRLDPSGLDFVSDFPWPGVGGDEFGDTFGDPSLPDSYGLTTSDEFLAHHLMGGWTCKSPKSWIVGAVA